MAEQCRCTNIAIMQLFHELKQAFPAVPDEVVAQCIRQNAHNKEVCERALRREVQTHMVHSYPSALMTGPSHTACGMAAAPCPDLPPVSPKRPGDLPSKPVVPPQRPGDPPSRPIVPSHRPGDPPSRPVVPPHRDGDPPSRPVVPPHRDGDPPSRSVVPSHRPGDPPSRPVVPSHRPGDLRARVRDLNLHIPPTRNDPFSASSLRSSSASTSPTTPHANASAGDSPRASSSPSTPQASATSNPFLAQMANGPLGNACDNVTVLDVNCSVSQQPRVTATVHMQPAPHFSPVVPPRSYTSVNLTLRPPSSEPQPPIDIHSAGSSLTYSTSSYDPRQGYQSQLQIRIGPGGLGSVSAQRTRAPVPPSPPVPPPRPQVHSLPVPEEENNPPVDVQSRLVAMGGEKLAPETREHLVRQLERRALLETELRKESEKLRTMQKEVAEMERDLQRRTAQSRPRAPPTLPVIQKVQRLRTEIQQLQNECTRMANEVDAKTPVTLPLGETDEEFYKNIYTGPSGSLWPRIPQSTPRRPEESGSESGWTCQVCTFHNHYLLEACETCDMPRIRIGRAATQDIHIRVTHHNFPTRRSLHGWVD